LFETPLWILRNLEEDRMIYHLDTLAYHLPIKSLKTVGCFGRSSINLWEKIILRLGKILILLPWSILLFLEAFG